MTWFVVVSQIGGTVCGTFGSALRADAEACADRVPGGAIIVETRQRPAVGSYFGAVVGPDSKAAPVPGSHAFWRVIGEK